MKATGIVRRVDDLGRIVIPKEIRRNLGIHKGETLEIYIEDDGVMFKKFEVNLPLEVQTLWNRVEENIPYDDPNHDAILDAISEVMILIKKSEG